MRNILRKLWYDRPLRTQLLVAVGLINLCALVAAGSVAIVNARNATRAEIDASLDLAKHFVRVTVEALQNGDPAALSKKFNQLSSRLQLARLRHVRIYVADATGGLTQVSPKENSTQRVAPAPSWFAALVEPSVTPQEISVVLSDPKSGTLLMIEEPRASVAHAWNLGTVVVAGEPADEVAEVWQDVSSVAIVWFGLMVAVLAVLYFVLGRILHPVEGLARGMVKLEDGDYAARLERPRVKEFALIAQRFNKLAEALGRAREENGRLYGQLITVQEDERREIANELHDEASPCLFGIMANAMSVQRLVERRHDRKSTDVKNHAGEILKVTERLKQMNRALLKRLRPVALGRVALPALVEDLIGEMQRRYPDVALSQAVKMNGASYSEAVDLTIYRCIQEGVTNAIRHGKADAVHVELFEKAGPGMTSDTNRQARTSGRNGNVVRAANGIASASPTLQLLIQDDGRGILPETALGFGLTVMRERVKALGGSCAIQSVPSQGATLRIVIPIAAAPASKAQRAERLEAH